MKYLSTLFLLTSIALFTGCGGNSPEPFKTSKPSVAKSGNLAYLVSGNVGSASDIENTAVVLTDSAKLFKAQGFNYFRIVNDKVTLTPKIITNISDLIAYCYPSTTGLSSLEDKCKLANSKGDIRFFLSASVKPSMDKFSWSINEVLEDPIMKKYYDSALLNFKDKTTSYEIISNKKMGKLLKRK